jgi:hypothetical protein
MLALAVAMVAPARAQDVLPRPAPPFGGRIGITAQDSVKDFTEAEARRNPGPRCHG